MPGDRVRLINETRWPEQEGREAVIACKAPMVKEADGVWYGLRWAEGSLPFYPLCDTLVDYVVFADPLRPPRLEALE